MIETSRPPRVGTLLRKYVSTITGHTATAWDSAEIFAKVLTRNDDSGRHGVLIPEEAYSFFPSLPISDPGQNATQVFSLTDTRGASERTVAWKYYQRYPERRITRLPGDLNSDDPRIVVFVHLKSRTGSGQYFLDLGAEPSAFRRLAALCFDPAGLEPTPGAFIRVPVGEPGYREDAPLRELLARFDSFRGRWIDALRSGDTGLGFTFESMMGVKENNDRTADFLGIELKTKLGKSAGRVQGKTNLFQEKPQWLDRMSLRDRIRQIGKLGEDGRWTCYSAVTVRENNLGLCLFPRDSDAHVSLQKKSQPIAFWPYETLKRRLTEKHSRAVFVRAESESKRGTTRFRYGELVYCERPQVENFISLIRSGDILVEFTMSEKDGGRIRDHGYPWRLKDQSLLGQLFTLQIRLREEERVTRS